MGPYEFARLLFNGSDLERLDLIANHLRTAEDDWRTLSLILKAVMEKHAGTEIPEDLRAAHALARAVETLTRMYSDAVLSIREDLLYLVERGASLAGTISSHSEHHVPPKVH